MNQTKVINDSITKKYGNRDETIQISIEESLTEKIDMTIHVIITAKENNP